jgi:hypothetical protein
VVAQVSYPCDETSVEAAQQIVGNVASALLIPLCELAAHHTFHVGQRFPGLSATAQLGEASATAASAASAAARAATTAAGVPLPSLDLRGDSLLLVAVALASCAYFTTFDAPLRRAQLDNAGGEPPK